MRIAFLTYRGKPHCGGQGVYTRHLTKALADLGHHVEVYSGQPYPHVVDDVPLHKLPSLDIYNDQFPGRMPAFWELKNVYDLAEVTAFSSGTFSEPLSFSLRAWGALRPRLGDFDLVHDNQTLGYGLLGIQNDGLPILESIHHPITVDRRLEIEHARTMVERFGKRRWYAFTKMQTRVAQRMLRVVTVSQSSFDDIVADHGVDPTRMAVVPVGVDPELYRPLPDVAKVPGMIVTTASADVALKGLRYLLEALAKVRVEHPDAHLVIIGKPKEGGSAMQVLRDLGLADHVEWISGVPDERIVELYSQCEVACVPSLYEGFSLPAIEAMSSGACLVATTGGALREVVGRDNDTALLCPPGDAEALAATLTKALRDPALRARIGAAGRQRVIDHWSWRHTAVRTVEQYEILLEEWRNRPPTKGVRSWLPKSLPGRSGFPLPAPATLPTAD